MSIVGGLPLVIGRVIRGGGCVGDVPLGMERLIEAERMAVERCAGRSTPGSTSGPPRRTASQGGA